MTEIEILRCLVDCIGDEDGKNCLDCPLYAIDDCLDLLYRDIVKLIGQLENDIDRYKRIARHQQSCNMARWFEIKRLEEEIERLKRGGNNGRH